MACLTYQDSRSARPVLPDTGSRPGGQAGYGRRCWSGKAGLLPYGTGAVPFPVRRMETITFCPGPGVLGIPVETLPGSSGKHQEQTGDENRGCLSISVGNVILPHLCSIMQVKSPFLDMEARAGSGFSASALCLSFVPGCSFTQIAAGRSGG